MKAKQIRLSVLLILVMGLLASSVWAGANERKTQEQQKQKRVQQQKQAQQNKPKRVANDPILKMATAMKELKLSTKQQKTIADIIKATKTSLVDATEAKNAAQREMRQAAGMGDDLNKKAIMDAANKLGKAMGEATYLRAKLMSELRSVLTPEQKAELNKIRKAASGKAVKEKPAQQAKVKKEKPTKKTTARKKKQKQD